MSSNFSIRIWRFSVSVYFTVEKYASFQIHWNYNK